MIAKYINEQDNLFASTLVRNTTPNQSASNNGQSSAKTAASHWNGKNNNTQQTKNQQPLRNQPNNRVPNNHRDKLFASTSNGTTKASNFNVRNNHNNASGNNRNTGAIPKNYNNSNRNSERNQVQPEIQAAGSSTGNNRGQNLSDLIDFSEEFSRTPVANNGRQGNEYKQSTGPSTSTPIAAETPAAPVKPPNVFDDDFFSFLEQSGAPTAPQLTEPMMANQSKPELPSVPQRQNSTINRSNQPPATRQQTNKPQSNQRAGSNTMNVAAGSSQGPDMKPVPPYMLNSLYLSYDKKQKEKQYFQNQKQKTNQSAGQRQLQRQPQTQGRSDQQTSAPETATNGTKIESDKLKKLFDEINKQKTQAEIRADCQRRYDQSETQSLIGVNTRSQRPGMQRSSSTVSLNRAQNQRNQDNGASSRRNLNSSNSSGGSRSNVTVKPTIDSE